MSKCPTSSFHDLFGMSKGHSLASKGRKQAENGPWVPSLLFLQFPNQDLKGIMFPLL